MKNELQMISVFALIAVSSLLVARSDAQADPLPGQTSDSRTVRGTINQAGELRDESGRAIGRIMMASPGTAFDISRMRIKSDGSVVDASGMAVGRMVFADEGARTGNAPTAQMAPVMPNTQLSPVTPANQFPPATTGYQPELIGPGRGMSERSVTMPRQPARSAAAEKRNKRAILMGMREEDLNSRRAKVANRIDNDLSEGRITEEQGAELKSELEATVRAQDRYERRGIIKDRDVIALYQSWDRIMGKLDVYLARNARSAIGLRTK